MGKQAPADDKAVTAAEKLAPVMDRSKAGTLTLSKDGVSVAVPVDAAKPEMSEAWGVFALAQEIAITKQAVDESPERELTRYAYAEYKVLAYTDAIAERPKEAAGLQRKLDAWTARRDDARKVAVKS